MVGQSGHHDMKGDGVQHGWVVYIANLETGDRVQHDEVHVRPSADI
jgi:predicted RNA-binding protein with TRAM domain